MSKMRSQCFLWCCSSAGKKQIECKVCGIIPVNEAQRFNSDIYAVNSHSGKLVKVFPRGSDKEALSMTHVNPQIVLVDRTTFERDYKHPVNESGENMKKIPGSKLSTEDQDLLYRFCEKYTRPAEMPNPREKILIRVKDGNVEIENINRAVTVPLYRRLGNEDALMLQAFKW